MTFVHKTCGDCHYARSAGPVSLANKTRRQCYGEPPQIMLVPAKNQQGFEAQVARPMVATTDVACSKYLVRDETDIEAPAPDNSMAALQASRSFIEQNCSPEVAGKLLAEIDKMLPKKPDVEVKAIPLAKAHPADFNKAGSAQGNDGFA